MMLDRYSGKSARLVNHIASHHGITTYEPSKELRKQREYGGGGPFMWDFNDVNLDAPAVSEIKQICLKLQDEITPMDLPDSGKTLAWLLSFVRHSHCSFWCKRYV